MKKFKENSFWKDTMILTIFLFSVELLFRVLENLELWDWALLRIFLSCFFLSFIVGFLLSFLSSMTKRRWIQAFFLFLASFYAWAQLGFRNFLGIFISLGTSSQMGAVASYIKEYLISFKIEYYVILLPFLLYLIFIVLEKNQKKEKIPVKTRMQMLGIGFLSLIGYVATLFVPFFQNEYQLVSNYKLFLSPINSSVAINQFGSSVFGILDIRQCLFPIHLLDDVSYEDESRVIDDTIWKQVIEEESDTVYNNLNRYFIQRPISESNDYTGYFEGKNVIVIMMESAGMMLEMEEYFPNFHKLLEHSWYWENNYSPRNACATGDNEFSTLTSLFPVNTSCTVNVYPENTYFSSMFQKFNEKGYTTSSYHDFDDTFYSRSIFHPNMGCQSYYDGNRLGISFNPKVYGEWPSDVELMEKSANLFTQNTPFMAWITTVSAHHPYEEASVLGDKYLSLFDQTNYPIGLKRYLSKLKVTDDALGMLIEVLEEKNVLKDTVIVAFGDHYPYGLGDQEVQSVVDYNVLDFYEIERVPFFIYQSELEPQVFSKNTYYMNILPTLANLFNLDYDPRFYFGEDLFSSDFSGRVIFADGSWQDDVARYNAVNSKIQYLTDVTYSSEDIQKINTDIYQMKEMSKLAITSNYFDYLTHAKQRVEENKEEENE